MSHYKTKPPWEFLLSASRNSLQSYELARLSHAANLRKEISVLLDQWLEENTMAMLARCLMQKPEICGHAVDARPAGNHGRNGGQTVSDNFFADEAAAQPTARGRA
jgi:hypothetical protein